MKKLLLFTLLFTSFFQYKSQNSISCGYDAVMQNVLKTHPAIKDLQTKRINESQIKKLKPASVPAYTIPVVFHILHLGGPENISDAQIKDAVAILNRDFRKKNADTISILSPFQAADVNFEFCLATKDTSGNCTTGIIRHYTPLANWDILPQNYIYTWNPSKYLNIYVVKGIPGFSYAGAYAYAPGSTGPSEDAIVAIHTGVGSIGTGTPLYSRGLTHEVGHWFDLPHIWGSGDPGQTCGDDGIFDTPVTMGFQTCPSTTMAICNASVAENHQNYEDYSGCGKMFTAGQAAHMNAVINATLAGRNNLWTNANLITTGVINPVSPCQLIAELGRSVNNYTVCEGQPLTFKDYSYNGTVTAWVWTASGGAVISNSNAATTGITFPAAGLQTVSLQVSNSTSSASDTKTVLVLSSLPNITGAYSESFEGTGLPTNFYINNIAGAPWAQTSVAAATGNKSYFIDGSQEPAGDVNTMETPVYDFLNNSGATFSFKYAYAKSTSTNTDVFKVQASECGADWTDIYLPGNTALSSGSGGILNSPFYPTPSQFKTYILSNHPAFIPFLNKASVKIRFYFKEDSVAGFGNNFFLDDINFDTPNGIRETKIENSINVFPNPADGILNVSFLKDKSNIVNSLMIFNSVGEMVKEAQDNNTYVNVKDLPQGFYVLRIKTVNGYIFNKPFVISRM